jgi:protein-tyrosine phosphatase
MAAAALRNELAAAGIRGAMVHSAGTIAKPGAPATPEAIEAAETCGLDISYHRATPLTRELVRRADLILVMEKSHLDTVRNLDQGAAEKTFMIGDWTDEAVRGADIPDPYGMPFNFYQIVLHRLCVAARRLADQIRGV